MNSGTPQFDVSLQFVRVIERRSDGFVEFEFAVGEPELFVEMLLPAEAYETFCRTNEVIHLDSRPEASEEDAEGWNWNLHQATHQRFR